MILHYFIAKILIFSHPFILILIFLNQNLYFNYRLLLIPLNHINY